MADSIDVLLTTKIIYSIYAIIIISLFAWFAFRLKSNAKSTFFSRPGLFYSYIGLLVFIGVSLHILTFKKIPWVSIDLKRDQITVSKTFKIVAENHKFILPSDKLTINCSEFVKFDVDSKDWTYGFGLIRKNHSLVMQMQVVPGSKNELVWKFHKNGIYSIKSTEYSGPKGVFMGVKDAVEVVGCKENDKFSMK